MLRYTLKFRKKAVKELNHLPNNVIKRIDTAILALAEDPHPAGCKKLKGAEDEWRIRVGDYRI